MNGFSRHRVTEAVSFLLRRDANVDVLQHRVARSPFLRILILKPRLNFRLDCRPWRGLKRADMKACRRPFDRVYKLLILLV